MHKSGLRDALNWGVVQYFRAKKIWKNILIANTPKIQQA